MIDPYNVSVGYVSGITDNKRKYKKGYGMDKLCTMAFYIVRNGRNSKILF